MYKYAGKRNNLIWDGDDTGITENSYPYTCIECGEQSQHSVTDLQDVRGVSNELVGYLLENKLVSQSDSYYFVKAGIPAYVVACSCPKCGANQYILIGLKEIQPQRYNIYRKSVISTE